MRTRGFVSRLLTAVLFTFSAVSLLGAPRLVLSQRHAAGIEGIAIDRDQTFAATNSEDGSLKIWHLASRRVVAELSIRPVLFAGMAFLSGGRLAYLQLQLPAGSQPVQQSLSVFNFLSSTTESYATGLELPVTFQVSADGRFAAVAGGNGGLSLIRLQTKEPPAMLWKERRDREWPQLAQVPNAVMRRTLREVPVATGINFAQSGETLAVGDSLGGVTLVDLKTMLMRTAVARAERRAVAGLAYAGGDLVVAFRNDSTENLQTRLWSGGDASQRIKIENTSTGQAIIELDAPYGGNVTFSPDGRKALAILHSLRQNPQISRLRPFIIDLSTGASVPIPGFKESDACFAIAPAGSLIAYGLRHSPTGDVFLWRPGMLEPKLMEIGFSYSVLDLRYLSLGKVLLSSHPGFTLAWDLTSGKHFASIPNMGGLDINTKGQAAYFDTRNKWLLTFWSFLMKPPEATHLPGRDVSDIRISEDGQSVLWVEGREFEKHVLVWSRNKGKPTEVCRTLARSPLAHSLDRRHFAVSCLGTDPQKNAIKMFHPQTFRETASWPEIGAHAMAFHPDGRRLILGVGNSIWAVDLATGEVAEESYVHATPGMFGAIAVLPDGAVAAAWTPPFGQEYQQLLIIGLDADEPLRQIPFSSSIESILVVGPWIFVGGKNGSVATLDAQTLDAKLTTVPVNQGWIHHTPSGHFDGRWDALQFVGWSKPEGGSVFPLDQFYNRFATPGLARRTWARDRTLQLEGNIADELVWPGVQTMLQMGLASIEWDAGLTYLCIDEVPREAAFSDFNPGRRPGCRYRKELFIENGTASTKSETHINSSRNIWADEVPDRAKTHATQLHLLTVALGEYRNSAAFATLDSAVGSARALSSRLKEIVEASGTFSAVRTWATLENADATRSRIISTLASIPKTFKSGDTVLLYLVGHGTVPPGQEMYYFAPYDAAPTNSAEFRDTSVNTALLVDAVSAIPARNLIVIIDSCQSGGALDSLIKAAETRQSIAAQFERPDSTYLLAATTSFRRVGLGTGDKRLSPIVEYLLSALEQTRAQGGSLRQVLELVFSRARAEADRGSGADRSLAPRPLVWGAGPDILLTGEAR